MSSEGQIGLGGMIPKGWMELGGIVNWVGVFWWHCQKDDACIGCNHWYRQRGRWSCVLVALSKGWQPSGIRRMLFSLNSKKKRQIKTKK